MTEIASKLYLCLEFATWRRNFFLQESFFKKVQTLRGGTHLVTSIRVLIPSSLQLLSETQPKVMFSELS